MYCIKVRAHEGNPYNESADLVAKKAIDTVDIGSSFTYREPKEVSNGKRKVPNCPDRTVQIQEKVLKSNSISRKSPKTPMKKVVITEQKRSREKEAELGNIKEPKLKKRNKASEDNSRSDKKIIPKVKLPRHPQIKRKANEGKSQSQADEEDKLSN